MIVSEKIIKVLLKIKNNIHFETYCCVNLIVRRRKYIAKKEQVRCGIKRGGTDLRREVVGNDFVLMSECILKIDVDT